MCLLSAMKLKDRISIIKGDITRIAADVIVNAANSSLTGGGGVDGAIHKAGGKKILDECLEIVSVHGPCQTGEAVITSAGLLPAKYVIHTVGPVWHGGKDNEKELLANCYTNSLELAVKHQVESVAFPNISTGVYHFPKAEAAKIAFETVSGFLGNDNSLKKVYFVCFDEENFVLYNNLYNNT